MDVKSWWSCGGGVLSWWSCGGGADCYLNKKTWRRRGVFWFLDERGERLVWGNGEGCCGEIYQLWEGDLLFSGFWARGQRRRPLDLGLNPKLAGRNILVLKFVCLAGEEDHGSSNYRLIQFIQPSSTKFWFGSHRFLVFLLASNIYNCVSASVT